MEYIQSALERAPFLYFQDALWPTLLPRAVYKCLVCLFLQNDPGILAAEKGLGIFIVFKVLKKCHQTQQPEDTFHKIFSCYSRAYMDSGFIILNDYFLLIHNQCYFKIQAQLLSGCRSDLSK